MSGKKDIEVREKESLPERRAPTLSLSSLDRSFWDMARRFDELFWRPFSWDFPSLEVAIPEFRTPLANISETDEKYNIEAELPGLKKEDIDITITEDTLEIKGETKKEEEEEEEGYIRREYRSSNYIRRFKLPENVDHDKIDASLVDGTLKVSLPKKEVEEPEKKKIDVK